MRWLLVIVLLGACRIPVSASEGLARPRLAKDRVSLLFVPTEMNGPHEVHVAYVQLTDALLAGLRADPRVHVEVAEHRPTELHALDGFDYVVTLSVVADATHGVQCVLSDPRDVINQLFWDRLAHNHGCAVESSAPWVAQAVVAVGFEDPRAKHEPINNALSRVFRASTKESQDWQPLLDARVAEATTWMQAALPHHFATEGTLVADGARTVLPVGERDGVHEGATFEIFLDQASDGFARVTRVAASTAELEWIYGGGALPVGARAVERGRAWLLELDPTIGVRALTVDHAGRSMTTTAATLGFRTRVHPYGSGLVLGAGLEGVLADHRGFTIGPEVGWEQRLRSRLQVHAIVDGYLLAGAFDGKTTLGTGTSAAVGATVTTHHTYVRVEGGYAWTTRLSASTDTFDFRGPFARLLFGLAP